MANGNGYKTSTIALLGIVVTGIGAWLIFGQDKVTRDEFTALRTEMRQGFDGLEGTHMQLREAVVRLNTILEER